MTKEKHEKTEELDIQEIDTAPVRRKTLPLLIQKQYVKDVSFESPNSPEILNITGRPEMDVSFNMNTNPIDMEAEDGTFYEVTLGLEVRARRGEKLAFIAEILYGIQVKILNEIPENKRHPMLYIEVPRYAFPFIRQIMTNLTQMGGFPPLLLAPVDFKALYAENFSQNAQINEEKRDPEQEKAKA